MNNCQNFSHQLLRRAGREGRASSRLARYYTSPGRPARFFDRGWFDGMLRRQQRNRPRRASLGLFQLRY